MLTAILMVQTEQKRVNEVAEKIAEIRGVSEVYSVTGDWDLVAIVRVKENEALSEVVTRQIVQIDGLVRTNTMIAFQAFSRHDLENLFSIGFNPER